MERHETPPPRRLELMPLATLLPNPANARVHRPDELRASYARFGYLTPIELDERTGMIAAGHGRHEMLMHMHSVGAPTPEGIEVTEDGGWLVPVVRGWSSADDTEAEAYLIAANRQALLGGWDRDELVPVLDELVASPSSISGTGFSMKDVMDWSLKPEADKPTVGDENDYGGLAALYRNKQVRSIIFDYPLEDYEAVAHTAHALLGAYSVETNAELFLVLLHQFDAEHPAPASATPEPVTA